MALVKNNLIQPDTWQEVDDEADLPSGQIIVSLTRWQQNREELLKRVGEIGLRLGSSENPEDVADDLGFFQVIALEFPTFMDGRAYSYARLIRDQYGFKGELRAVGNVLRDQLFLMCRVGFDAYEVNADDEKALQIWLDAQDEMHVYYQPTNDGRASVMSLRQRRRAAAKASSSA